MSPRPKLRPSRVLPAYVEALFEGRRVLVLGDSSSALAEEFLDRGARLVHVLDPEPARVAESAARNPSRSLFLGPLPPSGLGVRDGSFDLAVIEDLNAAGPAHSVVRRLRRALTPQGVALVAIPNPGARDRLLPADVLADGALDYYELYDALRGEFTTVQMLGQAPFVGYAVVDFSAANPEPSLDTSCVPGGAEEPEWFVAVASDAHLRLDEFSVIQLPLADTRRESRASAGGGEHTRRDARPSPDPETESLRQAVGERDRWIEQLEARAAVADERADEALAELEAAREAAEQQSVAAEQLEQVRRERDELRRQLNSTSDLLQQRTAALADAESGLAALSARGTAAGEEPETEYATELARLEHQLRERGSEVRRLSHDLATVERLARELLAELTEPGAVGAPLRAEGLTAQLDRLAHQNALREADLEAARWTIEALSAELSGGEPGALATELARARAELQQKATLLAQLRARAGVT
ncbi:MAG: hypothetical protein KF718_02615 [Polyangiaceae bacterium]|nr:hypothetical protein [Polyangiaceae bacterium]